MVANMIGSAVKDAGSDTMIIKFDELKRIYFESLGDVNGWNVAEMSAASGWTKKTIYNLAAEYQIDLKAKASEAKAASSGTETDIDHLTPEEIEYLAKPRW